MKVIDWLRGMVAAERISDSVLDELQRRIGVEPFATRDELAA